MRRKVKLYKLKPLARLPVSAQVAGEAIEEIRLANGGFISPRHLVEAARAKRHPLHPCFDWNDKTAADHARILRAGDILRWVVVVIKWERVEAPSTTRAFVVVKEGRGDEGRDRYTSVTVAMEDKGLRQQVLLQAKRDLLAWRRKYEELTELAAIFAAIDREL